MNRMRRFGICIALLGRISAASVAVANTESLKEVARKQNKHLFALFFRTGDTDGAKMKGVFAEAKRKLGRRALFSVASVSNPSEANFVRKYGIARAPLPLTLVFAPNGAIVKSFAGKVVSQSDLAGAFASPALAEVLGAMQDRKLVLLCIQGKRTRHNSESLGAARAAAQDEKARDSITVVRAAPDDGHSSDLLKQLSVSSKMQEATIFILVPPSTMAGKVEGATTKDALWKTIVTSVSSCSTGCGPSGCGK